MSGFILYQVLTACSILTVQYFTGLLVLQRGVKVNYTRKINHFALFLIPLLLGHLFSLQHSLGSFIFACVFMTAFLGVYTRPVRGKIPVLETMFKSFDRPEDRPHTLLWLFTQVLAGYMILIPMVILFVQSGFESVVALPLLINAFGDGLAEPVGVRFGKHKYRVYALFSKKPYVRSLEGSACVFLASLILIAGFKEAFTFDQLLAALFCIPLIMTLAEAFSPHTWDTPVLNITGYSILYAIMRLI